MSFTKLTPAGIDPQILAIGSLTDLPSQPFTMQRGNSILGKQIQQVKTVAAAPVVNNQAPLTVTRQPVSGGNFRYRVQFFQPPASQGYQSTNILLRTAQGSTTIATSGSAGPVQFTAPRSTAPTSVVQQQVNTSGAQSNPGIGTQGGNSRGLNVL